MPQSARHRAHEQSAMETLRWDLQQENDKESVRRLGKSPTTMRLSAADGREKGHVKGHPQRKPTDEREWGARKRGSLQAAMRIVLLFSFLANAAAPGEELDAPAYSFPLLLSFPFYGRTEAKNNVATARLPARRLSRAAV